jgi:hypothetical protein
MEDVLHWSDNGSDVKRREEERRGDDTAVADTKSYNKVN